ncbi:MAG: TetR/AcrR family transcriptional regulator [Treponema sp.]|nr:TetR/AcrR family transcriptional regulator [Treponema sp.]MBR1715164.1 TetR/AcrR family transcriptional regulator [Treponema sp.]
MARNKYPEKTEKLIISVATKLFLEKGYENTSLNDIVKNLGGLTKGAIYSHFKSKEEIYQAVVYELSASSDDAIEEIIKSDELNGRQKIVLVLKKSLEAAIENHKESGRVDYAKNPKMLYSLLLELKDEIAPLFILPIIEEGIADGSIITECPKELSELLAFVVNFWINPLVFESSPNEIVKKCKLFSSMLAPFNLDILDDELIDKLKELN